MSNVKTIGILYHPKSDEAKPLAEKLEKTLRSADTSVWLCSAWEEETARDKLNESKLIISIGGDGTILRAARIVLSHSIPILGINMGILGFLTELSAPEAERNLPALLSGKSWIDKRAMLQATVTRSGRTFHALNDIVIGRGIVARAINVNVRIDGVALNAYRGDGVIVATATGSTAYALAAGGPVLHPQSEDILIQPLATHLGRGFGLVLPATSVIELVAYSRHQAILSVDGQNNLPLEDGETIEIKQSPYSTGFLRFKPKASFYGTLTQKLAGN